MYRLAEKCPKIVRVFSEHIHHQEFPIPRDYASSRTNTKYDGLTKAEMRKVALHHLIRDPVNQPDYAEQILALDEKFRQALDKNVRHVSAEDIQDKEIAAYKRLIKEASISELKKYDVILCSCSVSASPRIDR